ncbi:YCF48-related protein [Pseudomonas sp. 5Ae-yellow]|uniref:WD40/YVTN/BNR-like repeat-containing protein n=1 Tax=Pseudomonas sp. 5Ae-yellow TaxID=2759848 RepID=UPI0015F701BE|nr:YCF48-related protein [Pseudomonas sp. 5Ae-yellow]MBA6420972.1 glycosyl hydrolase [Pseudomonas sp. 5Ae-yellow]
MSNLSKIEHLASLQLSRPSATARVGKAVLAVLPWAIIAGLLCAGLFIRPQPIGGTVTPAALERRDHFYGLALTPGGDVWVSGSYGKILSIASDGAIEKLTTPTELTLQDIAIWDVNHAVAVGNDGVILYSQNAGESWTVAAGVPRSEVANKLNRVRIAPGGLAIATGEMGALLISRDYGQNWQRLREEEDVAWNDVAILEDGRLVVVGEFGQVLIGDLEGQLWTDVEPPVPDSLMSVQFRDAQNGVAVGLEGAVLVTQDGGYSWEGVDLGMTDHLFDVLWVEQQGCWFVSGALGRWASGGEKGWKTGVLDERSRAWHTSALVVESDIWLAGADIGRWDGGRWFELQP